MTDEWLTFERSTDRGRTWERVAVRRTSLLGSAGVPEAPAYYDDGYNWYRRPNTGDTNE